MNEDRYILHEHLVAVIDGVIHDTSDPSRGGATGQSCETIPSATVGEISVAIFLAHDVLA